MYKRRRLRPEQKVIIIYEVEVGFVQTDAIFQGYRSIIYAGVTHDIPVFEKGNSEITGMQCFWVLPEEIKNLDEIPRLQYDLIDLQITALEAAESVGYEIPQKIKDKEIRKMVDDSIEQVNTLIKKLGYDPRDESWVETSLAITDRERNWFKFERENGLMFSTNWDDIVAVYNEQQKDVISPEQAKNLSKKRMRYILGAYHIRMSGNADRDDWKSAAREFEQNHRAIENRMMDWSIARQGKFPMVRVKNPVRFWSGPYFHECLEKIPHVFVDTTITQIKPGVVLRVLSYDPKSKYIRLDFTTDIREQIKPGGDGPRPWVKDQADYDVWLLPGDLEEHLDILEPLMQKQE